MIKLDSRHSSTERLEHDGHILLEHLRSGMGALLDGRLERDATNQNVYRIRFYDNTNFIIAEMYAQRDRDYIIFYTDLFDQNLINIEKIVGSKSHVEARAYSCFTPYQYFRDQRIN